MSGRRERSVPADAVERYAGFDQRWQRRQGWQAARAGDRQRLQPAVFDKRRHRNRIQETYCHRPGQDVGQGQHPALVGNMQHLHLGQVIDALAERWDGVALPKDANETLSPRRADAITSWMLVAAASGRVTTSRGTIAIWATPVKSFTGS